MSPCSLLAPVHWVSPGAHPTKATPPLHFSDLKRAFLSQGCHTCCCFSLVCTFSQHSVGLSAHHSGFRANVINFLTKAFQSNAHHCSPSPSIWPVFLFTHNPPLPFLCTVHSVKLSKLWFMCLFTFCLLCLWYRLPVDVVFSVPFTNAWPRQGTEWSFDTFTLGEWINQYLSAPMVSNRLYLLTREFRPC